METRLSLDIEAGNQALTEDKRELKSLQTIKIKT